MCVLGLTHRFCCVLGTYIGLEQRQEIQMSKHLTNLYKSISPNVSDHYIFQAFSNPVVEDQFIGMAFCNTSTSETAQHVANAIQICNGEMAIHHSILIELMQIHNEASKMLNFHQANFDSALEMYEQNKRTSTIHEEKDLGNQANTLIRSGRSLKMVWIIGYSP